MPIVDLSRAGQSVDMTSPTLVDFNKLDTPPISTMWSWLSTSGADIDVQGEGMTFDGSGRALTGTAATINIDVGNNDDVNPDVAISFAGASAPLLDDGVESFWRMLSGNDSFKGALTQYAGAAATFKLVGDGLSAPRGENLGGDDAFHLGNTKTHAIGDVSIVGSDVTTMPRVLFEGGNDSMTGFNTTLDQVMIGDAATVFATGTLTGGDDIMTLNARGFASAVYGDALEVKGSQKLSVTIFGGDDDIIAGQGTTALLVGDVHNQSDFSSVLGGNDQIDGNSEGDVIIGDVHNAVGSVIGGADTIYGAGGDDTINGDVQNGGRSRIVGGNDLIHGGDGQDSISGDLQNVTAGNFAIGGHDRIFGEAGDDRITAHGGDDLLDGGAGADVLTGGKGNDVYATDSNMDTVLEGANEGIDTIRTTINDTFIWSNVENMHFVGSGEFRVLDNELSNKVVGGAGDDTFLLHGSGNDSFSGGAGFDTLDFRTLGGALVNLATNKNGGSATGDNFTGIERIHGSAKGNDALAGAAVRVVLSGYGGNDALRGSGKNDSLYGGDGNDTIEGGAGNEDFLGGEAGNDVIDGGDGNDVVDGGEGSDALRGGLGADTLSAGAGNDRLDGGAGADRLDGGAGGDAAAYASATAGLRVDLLNAGLNTGIANGDSFASIENLSGSAFNDTLGGDNANNALSGAGGNDTLLGKGGNDRLDGQGGNDTMLGGDGGDTFVFTRGSKADRLGDFVNGVDRIDLTDFDFASYAAVKALASDTAAGLRIGIGGDVLIVDGFKLASFDAGDVLI